MRSDAAATRSCAYDVPMRLWHGLSLVLLASCSAAHEAPTGASEHTTDAETDAEIDASPPAGRDDLALLERVWDALCDRRVVCGASSGYLPGYCAHATLHALLGEPILRGDAHVDVERARTCLARLGSLGPCHLRTRPSPWADVSDDMLDARVACESVVVFDPTHCGSDLCAPGDWCLVDDVCVARCPDSVGAHQGARDEPCGTGPVSCRAGLQCQSRGDGISTAFCEAPCSPAACRAAGYDGCSWSWALPPSIQCFRLLALGEPCNETTAPCVAQAVCDPLVTHTCVARSSFAARGESCVTRRCEPGTSACDDVSGLCVAPASLSGTCTRSEECEAGEYCHSDGTIGTCSRSPDGAACTGGDTDELASFDSCPDGYECSRYVPPVGRVCVRALEMGATCTADDHCADGGGCVRGVCTRLTRPWEACTDAVPCLYAFTCAGGQCAGALRSIGDPCRDGACDHGTCIDGVCAPRPDGAACRSWLDCRRDCVAGVCTDGAVSAGGGCAGQFECREGLRCQTSATGRLGRCCP